jgi:glycosyltransferase involved in cell wall biosynthesis/predicted SAM-dependent methyltransferase
MVKEIEIIVPFKRDGDILEVGGGDIPMFHPNFDMRKLPTVDIVGDLEGDWPISDKTYDGVFGKFIIEHICWRLLPKFVSECYRVLKNGGSVMMVGPNTLEQCAEITRRNKIGIDESSMIFGGQEEAGWNEHKAAFSPEYAIELFKGAGFERVEVEPWPVAKTDMIIRAWKGQTDVDNLKWRQEMDVKMNNNFKGVKTHNAPPVGQESVKQPRLKLNIGSFTVMFKGWVNMDILDLNDYARQNGFEFRQCDVTKGLPQKSETVDAIVTSHLLEHISRADGLKFLRECLRVLKPEGILRVAVPDTMKIAEAWVHKGLKGTFDYNEGVKNAEDDAEAFWNFVFSGHVTAYDAKSVTVKMMEAGFKCKEQQPGMSMDRDIAEETKDMYPDHSSYIEGIKPKITTSGPTTDIKLDVTDRPLKIGLISTPFFNCPPKGYSGLEMVVWDLACGLSALGHKVTLYAPEGSKAPPNGELVITGPSITDVNVNWVEKEQNVNNVVAQSFKDLDILHGHNWFGFEYLLRNNGPKICHTHHGHLNSDWWLKEKSPFKLNFIAISKWMKTLYDKQGIPSEYVYNGIDLSRYEFQEKKGDRLLYVGRISKFKQPHIAISLAKRLNVGLDIVGGTFVDDKQYLSDIKFACDGKQITFNPDVDHETKIKFMQNAKCLLFPSNMGEPFGLVAAEAMACGTPVVALNDGAISEVVNDGTTGYVLPDYDKIESAMQLTTKLNLITPNACRVRTLTMFSRKVMAENYVRLYRSILQNQEW